jgi:acylpyruvate hydrolase
MNTVHLTQSNEDIIVPKIFCLGKNYAKHAAEMSKWDPAGKSEVPQKPIIFMKPSSSIVHNGARIEIPRITNDMHHETEIYFVIGKQGKNIPKDDARSFITAMGVGLDLTLRDIQTELRNSGNPWLISKGFDGSAPISDAVPIDGVDFDSLQIRLNVNDRMRQHGYYKDTIFKIEHIVSYLSGLFTLERGDLVFTGTPEGVARLNHGDKLHAELVGFTELHVEII